MRRAATIPEEDRNCSNYRLRYKSMADFERTGKPFLQPRLDEISGTSGDTMMTLKNSRDASDNITYNNLLDQLAFLERDVNAYIQCIQSDILQRNDYSSKIYNLQQEVENARKTLKERKQTAEEAKERAAEVGDPYANTTWWQSWFPLGRPIQKENVPVLLAISIFMLVFSLGIFLRFAGIELQFVNLSESMSNFSKNLNPSKYP